MALALLVLVGGMAMSGCDRENGVPPQPAANNESQAGAPKRYSIDRSHAGATLPTNAVRNEQGQAAHLADLSGKPIILNLWATWCGPCVEELPTLNRLAAATSTRAHIIGLSQDIGDDGHGPREFLAARGWGNIRSWHDPDNAIGLVYGGGLPTTILFDATGHEVARVIGPLDWTGAEAAALLAQAGAAI
ncbi:MAG: TlpA disulfide reductase family protein [Sphingopyxis sp.]